MKVPAGFRESVENEPGGLSPAAVVSPLRARLLVTVRNLGPGLITGASDDDPSGISTYSIAGASFGYSFLWTALFSFPLMTAVQLMCARLGTVKGKGLAAIVREHYPRWVLWGTCGLLLFANLVNASADLAGMADATQLATGQSHRLDSDLHGRHHRAAFLVLIPLHLEHLPLAHAGSSRICRHGFSGGI